MPYSILLFLFAFFVIKKEESKSSLIRYHFRFFEAISVSLGDSKNRDSTVYIYYIAALLEQRWRKAKDINERATENLLSLSAQSKG